MKLTFLGTGTSQGVPVIGCECEVCQSEDTKDQRLRTAAMIELNQSTIVFDTGPDFRQQMLLAKVKEVSAILFTHEHKDHVAGLDDVRAFNFRSKLPMPIYCTEQVHESLKQEYKYIFDDQYSYPGIPKIQANIIQNKPFIVDDIEVLPIQVWHYKLPVFGYRIKDVAYITDANRIEETEKEKLKGLKVLVVNALRKEEHISHFNLKQAIELATELQAEQTYFTHMSHLMGKHASIDDELPPNISLAYDGLEICIR
jgi:phosphoribosyl 1,2-cyclic phosphate phosphodiesterase